MTSQQSNVIFTNIPCFFNMFIVFIIANLLKQFINPNFNFLWIEKSAIIKMTYCYFYLNDILFTKGSAYPS